MPGDESDSTRENESLIAPVARKVSSQYSSNLLDKLFQFRGGEYPTSDVHHIANAVQFERVLEEAGDKLVVVDFSASWCMPCKMIAPFFEEMATVFPDAVFVKVDVDEVPQVSSKYEVMSMPTFLFLKKSKIVDRFSGASVDKLRDTITSLL